MSVNINSNIWSFTLSEDVESIGELLQDGVSVDARNSLGETPLHLAARRGLECVAKVRIVFFSTEKLFWTSTDIAAGCIVLALGYT